MELPPFTDGRSALPDDILLLVLEKLGSAGEAISSWVLSRRWAGLPWLLPEPEIRIRDFLPGETELYELRTAELSRAMKAFCRAVSRFMSAAEATTRCLRLEFFLANGCTSTVQRLLGGAGCRKVSALQFAIRTTVHQVDCSEAQMRTYARRFERFMAGSPLGLFRLLTRLELRNLWLGSPDVAAILSACQRLERLALCHCYRNNSRRREALVIDAPPRSALRELVLEMCFYRLVVLRNLPKLTRLTCDIWATVGAPLSLCSVSRLETLVLGNAAARWSKAFSLSKLLANTTSLRCLSLNFEAEEIWIQPEPPRPLCAAFGKLTALFVGGIFVQCDLLWMMFLLEAAPFLREFRIAVQKHFCNGEDYKEERKYSLLGWKLSDFRHNHPENLRVSGFQVEDKFLTFIRLVMERATNLKTVVLADEEPCVHCDPADGRTSAITGSRYPKNNDEKCSIVKQLKDESSSSVQIFIR